MKKVYIILIGLLVAFTFSCEKEDETGVGSMELEATVGISLVEITWKRPVREVNIDVSYDIYLNDELLEANKLNPGYELEDLPLDTPYVFKVIGDIDGVIYTDEITFSTFNPDDFTLLLKSIGTSGVSSVLTYNNAAKLSIADGFGRIVFEYDTQGRLSRQEESFSSGSRWSEFVYTGNRFASINTTLAGPDFNEVRDFTFSGTNTYSIDILQANDSGDPPLTFTRTVLLTRNAQGEIVTFKMFKEDGSIADNMQFTYANGNLIKLVDLIESKTYDITYDTNKSYVTYTAFYSTFSMPIQRFAAGVSWPYDTYNRFINIPELFLRQNINNILSIRVDGVLDSSYSYDYKGSEYPFSITYSNGVTKDLVYFFEER